MRIGCLQFAPALGDVAGNIERADAILAKAAPHHLDLLMLPELAFTGYNHPSLAAIEPYLESTAVGPSTAWAIAAARRLGCHVSVGYPEKSTATPRVLYNAVVLVSPEGLVVWHYRKRFLYYTDETWAQEGDDADFTTRHVEGLGHDVAMGICMDLNPYRFQSAWDTYEFSSQAAASRASLILVTMAWNATRDSPWPPNEASMPDMSTLGYWFERLQPLLTASGRSLDDPTAGAAKEVLVAMCNRSGAEGSAIYAGSSTVMGIVDGRAILYGALGRDAEELLVVDSSEKQDAAELRMRVAACQG
ncbi:MAG: Carbon-nitrogen hydrolase [Thelocarpon impressellum]|nr:MAG: Carbon-nitrogen hydrolase [Thelocarpon impressellum]